VVGVNAPAAALPLGGRGRDRRTTDREAARRYLVAKIAGQRRIIADPRAFTSYDPAWIIADAEQRLRWLDCAPEGARFCLAPFQDKNGVPMGSAWRENLGPCKALREAYAARGFHPLGGAAHRATRGAA